MTPEIQAQIIEAMKPLADLIAAAQKAVAELNETTDRMVQDVRLQFPSLPDYYFPPLPGEYRHG